MPNPDYRKLALERAQETDPVKRREIEKQLFVFEEELTEEEKSLFGYWTEGYIQDDPGVVNGKLTSYVGAYFDESGNTTQ